MQYSTQLVALSLCGLSLGTPFPDDDPNSICLPWEACRLQTAEILRGRVAVHALCPNPKEYTEQPPGNNSYIFSRLYLDQCYGLSADSLSFYSINTNETDGLHYPGDNITTACNISSASPRVNATTWTLSGDLWFSGNCIGHGNFTTKLQLNVSNMHSCGGQLVCGDSKLAKDENISTGAFMVAGSCTKSNLLHGEIAWNHTGAELGAYCESYADVSEDAVPLYTVLNLADCLARYPVLLDSLNSTAEAITKAVKACPTKNITLDPSSSTLTIGCDPFKSKPIDIAAFVRSENGRLACYDVPGRMASPAEVVEIRGNNGTRLTRRKHYLHDWRNGPRAHT